MRALWEDFFKSSPNANFETEYMFVAEDKFTIRWRHRWTDGDRKKEWIRGVDVFTLMDGKVAEKLA